MAAGVLACPFCNSQFTVESGTVRGDKLHCPRCGETQPPVGQAFLLAGASADRNVRPTTTPTVRPVNWKFGLTILVFMLAMASLGLVFALRTQSQRRDNDFRAKTKATTEQAPGAPGELTGLGYLPQGTNVVAGLRVSDLLADPAGRELLKEPQPGWLQATLGNVERWTGLKASELDHLVLGLTLENKLPQLTIVVQTAKPYSPAALEGALAPAKPVNHRDKALYRFPIKPVGEGLLWCPGPRTLVVLVRLDAAKIEDMAAIPIQARPNLEALAPAAKALLTERVTKQSLVWLAGHWQANSALETLTAFTPIPKDEANALANLQALAVSLYPQDGWTLDAHFQGSGPAANQALERYLRAKTFPQAKSYKVLGPPDDADPDARWVTLQARMEVDALRKLPLAK